MDSEIKTRITPVDKVGVELAEGNDCLVVIYSSDPTRLSKRVLLEGTAMNVGRGSENHLVLDSDSVSRRHARFERRGRHWYVTDLGSTNGTYINDDPEPVRERQLRRGDQVKIGDTIFKYLSGTDIEAQYHETIHKVMMVDGLTGASNRRHLMEQLTREIPRARRHGRPLGLLMLDIDHFKKINDTFGHLAGDHVLKEVSHVMQSRLRPDDVLGRYGGEEFTVVLPETDLAGAMALGEDIRKLIENAKITFDGEPISVTISIGAAILANPAWDAAQFVKAADEKLYAAKRGGRNRVVG